MAMNYSSWRNTSLICIRSIFLVLYLWYHSPGTIGTCIRIGSWFPWPRWMAALGKTALEFAADLGSESTPPKTTMDTRQSLDSIWNIFWNPSFLDIYVNIFFFFGGGNTFWDLVLARFLSSKFKFCRVEVGGGCNITIQILSQSNSDMVSGSKPIGFSRWIVDTPAYIQQTWML